MHAYSASAERQAGGKQNGVQWKRLSNSFIRLRSSASLQI